MLKAISKYGLAAHLALAAALPAALSPFCSEYVLIRLTFLLSALALVWTLSDPSIRTGENASTARRRVLVSVLKSPVFWIMTVVCLIALIRCLNDGVVRVFDSEKGVWSVSGGTFPLLPGAVPGSGVFPFAVTVSSLTVAVGLLYAAGRAARVWFALAAAFVMGVSGLALCTVALLGIEPFASATVAGFGTLRFAGVFYAVSLLLVLAGGIGAEELRWGASRFPFGLALGGCLAGTVFFLPSPVAAAFLLPAVAFAVFGLFRLHRRMGSACTARAAIMVFFGLFIAAMAFAMPTAAKVTVEKIAGLSGEKMFSENQKALSKVYRETSLELWRRRPWCGVGLGAYRVQVPFVAEKDVWEILPADVEIPCNGYLGLLCERGILGCLAVGGTVLVLLIAWVLRLLGLWRVSRGRHEGDLFAFDAPLGGWTWIGALPVFALAVFSAVFTQPTLWPVVVGLLAFAAASFPRVTHSERKD